MKYIDWSEVKNTYLKTARGICFEDIQTAIEDGKLLADIPHPQKQLRPNQKVFIVEFDGYAYVVPYVEDEVKIFLKTIYASRKMTKRYLSKGSKS